MTKKEAYEYIKNNKEEFSNKEEIKQFLRDNIIYPVAYIYYLQDPEMKDKNCYVGQTTNTLNERLRSHIKDVKREKKEQKNNYRRNWILSLLNKNVKPEILVIEELYNVKQNEIDEAEIWHIKRFKDLGIKLINSTSGGKTAINLPEVLTSISNTLKRKYASGEIICHQKGKPHTEESKKKMSLAKKGKPAHPNTVAASKLRRGKPGKPHTEETKQLLSKSKQGSNHPQSKLTEQDVYEIKRLLFENKLMIKEIALLFGIPRQLISAMINGRRWRHCFTNKELIQLQRLQQQNKIKRTTGKNNPMYGKTGHLNPNNKLYKKRMSNA